MQQATPPSSNAAPALRRVHTCASLTALGVGGIIGSGIFVMAGMAAGLAGPALMVSCLVAGVAAIAAAFTLVLLWAVWRSGSSAVRGLRWAPLRLFGKLCYGLYVLHIGANLVADGVLERFAPQVRELSWLEFPISVTVSLAVAWLSWMCFEEPVLRLKRYFEYREGSPR